MTREDFRRELGDAFDAISGSPSPALSDRVRSSLAEAPEPRGSMWMAGVAAAVIAVILIGVLIVANPLNRHSMVVPGGGPSSSPSSPQTPAPTPDATPSAGLPSFVCGVTGIVSKPTSPPQPPVAFVSAVRTGSHAGYDRVTIEFSNTDPANTDVTPQSGTTFTQGGSGQPVTLAGQAGILVSIHSADAHTAYNGPTDFKTGYPVMAEVRQVEDFEGHVQWGIGLSKTACYRAFYLTNPTRLVIDVQAG